MHTFKKHFQKDGSYKIGYYYKGQFQKYVNENKPLYMNWKKENSIEEIPYIAPVKKVKTKKQLIATAKANTETRKKEEYNKRLWEASQEYADLQVELSNIDSMTIEELQAL